MARPDRLAPRNATGRSSKVTTGSQRSYGRASTFSTSSMHAMYSASSVGTHHIFFPPRLQVVVGEHLANGLAAHVGDNPPALALLGGHTDCPPRIAHWGRPTYHRHNRRLLASIQQLRGLRTRIVRQRGVDAVLDIPPANAPHLAWVRPHCRGDIGERPFRVEQLEDSRSEERRVGKECRSRWSSCDYKTE